LRKKGVEEGKRTRKEEAGGKKKKASALLFAMDHVILRKHQNEQQ
jgi:hypothetical protein